MRPTLSAVALSFLAVVGPWPLAGQSANAPPETAAAATPESHIGRRVLIGSVVGAAFGGTFWLSMYTCCAEQQDVVTYFGNPIVYAAVGAVIGGLVGWGTGLEHRGRRTRQGRALLSTGREGKLAAGVPAVIFDPARGRSQVALLEIRVRRP